MPTTSWVDADFGLRGIPDRTDETGVAVKDISGREDALINEVLTAGVVKPDAAFAPSKGSGDFDVDVGSGSADADLFVVESQAVGQAPYLVQLQATSVTVTLDAADADPRVDEIYLVVLDAGRDGNVDGLGLPRISYRKGDSASSPDAPGPAAEWEAWALLASVDVPGGAPSISAGDVTDQRAHANMTLQGVGGVEVFTSQFSTTFTVPSGVTRIKATIVGGGGAGGGGPDQQNLGGGGGGGGGATVIGTLAVTPGEALDAVPGSGGSGSSGAGADGGTSTIERDGTVLASAGGGSGGSEIGSVGDSGLGGGGGTGGTEPSDGVKINGGPGGSGSPRLSQADDDIVAVGGFGGSSSFGNGDTTLWSHIDRNGQNAGTHGAGGGGGVSITGTSDGGNGRGGVIVIEW